MSTKDPVTALLQGTLALAGTTAIIPSLPAPIKTGIEALVGAQTSVPTDANTPLLAALILIAMFHLAWHAAGYALAMLSEIANALAAVTASAFGRARYRRRHP